MLLKIVLVQKLVHICGGKLGVEMYTALFWCGALWNDDSVS